MTRHLALPFLVAAFAAVAPAHVTAQPQDLLLPAQASAPSRRDVPHKRMRKARVDLPALNSAALRLHLFDDVQPVVTRDKVERPDGDTLVWTGRSEDGTQAVLTVARGVMTGTVYSDHRAFEIMLEPDGQYSVAELDPGAFPTDDPMFDDLQFEILEHPDAFVGDQAAMASSPTVAYETTTGTPVEIDVMIVWTPKAETAVGGRAAMDSLALNAVANANLAYTNSGVNARLRLVYGGPVSFVETASNISGDLSALRGTTDGKLDEVHNLRTTHGADIVTLFGDGYRSAGYCGIGSLMTTVSTSFASSAFNVVDRGCAVGNLSYAHEVGHNQGLHHDPANASSTASSPYAYGYQDPGGYFRTVLSYGSATRIPYLSSPNVLYNGRVTGTAGQDNARTLNNNVGTIAAFRSAAGASPAPRPTPTCTYSVSTTSLSFSASGGAKSVTVTAPTGCAWTASNGGVTWVSLSSTGGSGNGAVTVSVPSNASGARSAAVTIAGKQVAVNQSGVKANGKRTGDRTTR